MIETLSTDSPLPSALAYHSAHISGAITAVSTNSSGLRRPKLSMVAPSSGPVKATNSP